MRHTNGQAVTFASALTSSGGLLTKLGSGTLTLLGANTFTGGAAITNGVLALVGGAAISDSANVSLTGNTARLQVVTSETIGSLAGNFTNSTVTLGNGIVLSTGANNASTTFAGAITGGNDTSGLTKTGTGTFTLSGVNTYTGGTAVAAGTLAVGGNGTLGGPAGNLTIAAGAALDISNSTAGLSVGAFNDSGALALGQRNLSVALDYVNAGSGNSFNARGNVTGTGAINATGTTAQAVAGGVIAGGTTTAPTLGIGNIHEGNTVTATYSVANSGTTGPALRGALQTTVNGGNVTDPRLSGTGVTAANFGPLTPGNSTASLGVTLTGSAPGALVGQSVAVVNNFDNVPDQVLMLTGAVYRYAAAGALTGLNFGSVHEGDVAQQALTVTNSAAATGGFTENLSGASGNVTGNATDSGSFNGLAVGGNSTALVIGVNTATAGAKSGNATYAFSSQAINGSGLGTTALTPQTVSVSAAVYNFATGSGLPASVDLGIVHVGDVVTDTLTVSNTAAASGGFTESLGAAFGLPSGAFSGSGSVTGLVPGASSTALKVTLNTAAAASLTAVPVSVNFTSQAVPGSGLGNTALAPQTTAFTAQVNNYAAPAYSLASGGANLSLLSPTTAVLDFGQVVAGNGFVSVQLHLGNAAAAPADSLKGSFAVSNPSAAFFITGASDFTNLAAGAYQSFQVGLNINQLGSFSELLTLDGTSQNGSGYAGSLGEFQLQIQGTVAIPEPAQTTALIGLTFLMLMIARQKLRLRARNAAACTG